MGLCSIDKQGIIILNAGNLSNKRAFLSNKSAFFVRQVKKIIFLGALIFKGFHYFCNPVTDSSKKTVMVV